MRETTHVLLVGPHATRFARHFKLERLSRQTAKGVRRRRPVPVTTHGLKTSALFRAMTRHVLDLCDKHGRETVGAVALDRSGTVAAGASTGGIDIMLPGRVGDTPLIGCGVYADNEGGAVSMTGWGESIIRMAVAKAIMDHLISGKTPAVAVQHVLKTLVLRVSGAAGAIVLAPNGRMTIRHTTPRMAAGYWNGRHRPVVKDRF
jgi:beta-aspartyl-peptidase (threonine type)